MTPRHSSSRRSASHLAALILLAVLTGGASPVYGQSRQNDSARQSNGEGEMQSSDLDPSDYFGDADRDTLSDLLKKSRPSDASKSDSADSPTGSKSDDELASDEPTASLADDDSAASEDEDEANEELRAKIARQRALMGYLSKLQKPVSDIRIAVSQADVNGRPANRAEQLTDHLAPQWVTGSASSPRVSDRYPVAFCHHPLYFQQVDLERCGQHHGCLQNAISAGHFLYGVAVLPYRLVTQCPESHTRSLGDCRSGQSFSMPIEPLSGHGNCKRGIAAQAAAIAGFSFLLL